MTSEHNRMTLAVAEPSEQLRRALNVFFEHCSDAELCACCGTGRQLLGCLRQGLRPEAVVLDAACDNVLDLAGEIRRVSPGYLPLVALTIPSNALLNEKILLTSGVDCVILKPYRIPGMLKLLYQHGRQDASFQEYLRRSTFEGCLGSIGAGPEQAGSDYLWKMFREEEQAGRPCANNALYHCVADRENITWSGVRNGVRRLAETLWRNCTPGYRAFCERYGKSLDQPLTEKELYSCLARDCRDKMR